MQIHYKRRQHHLLNVFIVNTQTLTSQQCCVDFMRDEALHKSTFSIRHLSTSLITTIFWSECQVPALSASLTEDDLTFSGFLRTTIMNTQLCTMLYPSRTSGLAMHKWPQELCCSDLVPVSLCPFHLLP